MFLIIYQNFCIKSYECFLNLWDVYFGRMHPECYIFPVQHEQDSGLTVLDGYQLTKDYEMITLQIFVVMVQGSRLLLSMRIK